MVEDVGSGSDLGLPMGLLKRADGIYIDLGLPKPALIAAVGHVFQSGWYFPGLNYPVLIKALSLRSSVTSDTPARMLAAGTPMGRARPSSVTLARGLARIAVPP